MQPGDTKGDTKLTTVLIRNFEERKNLARYLHQQPRHGTISYRDFVNVAPLQFGKRNFARSSSRRPESDAPQ
jgi:hypothetical protein